MLSASLAIKDNSNNTIIISIEDGFAIASSENDDFIDLDILPLVKSKLDQEKASRSPNQTHIKILTFWIRLFQENQKAKLSNPNPTPNPTKEEIKQALNSIEQSEKSNQLDAQIISQEDLNQDQNKESN